MMLLISENGTGFSTGAPAAASSMQWRMFITATINGSQPTLGEIEMRESLGGADACSGGIAAASSEWSSSESAANAFDNDIATPWTANSSDIGDGSAWIEYQFAAPVAIRQFAITARNNYTDYSPKDFDFRYWDGATWVTVITVVNAPQPAASEVRLYDVP